MFHGEGHSVRTHDLLEIDAKQLLSSQASAPNWVEEELRESPFAVVRRGLAPGNQIPIGVRGRGRNQRWAAFCDPKLVKSILTPRQLLTRAIPTSRANAIPALRALDLLKERWMESVLPWGPGGSVGFELASGSHVATPESDLDIVIYAERRMTAEEAKSLYDRSINLPEVVDIRVETPVCGFPLKEFAGRGPAAILLRLPRGFVLAKDPWGDEIGSMDPNYAAGTSILAPRDCGRLLKNECRRTEVQMNRRKGAAK
ncbi:MAG TPA: malonate decarboxylase holo-ACP synthase [Terriglobales bacterium]|jgi:phosphoribosyl-dephospho-CoA transferase|nr:malonate decarboxylase holo-ACP synthase [Terriglobales bacterium]